MPSRPLLHIQNVELDINQVEIGGFTRTAHGMVTRWGIKLTTEMKAAMQARTLAETTRYGRGIMGNSYTVVLAQTGESSCEIRVRNRAKYAKYVLLGTPPVITSAKRMPIGKSQLGLGALPTPSNVNLTLRTEVPGQKGRNFMMFGVRTVLAVHKIKSIG